MARRDKLNSPLSIDLIVLDIGLLKLNGYNACRQLREKAWAKETLIAAATGWGQERVLGNGHCLADSLVNSVDLLTYPIELLDDGIGL